jgi:hypothetical protein
MERNIKKITRGKTSRNPEETGTRIRLEEGIAETILKTTLKIKNTFVPAYELHAIRFRYSLVRAI